MSTAQDQLARFVGQWTPPFVVEVEAGAIRKFALAIGETRALHLDANVARAAGLRGLVAPPTYPTCFRPPVEPPWIVGLDRRRLLAGGMAFDYVRPIVAGMRLVCRLQLTAVEEKTGHTGSMWLLKQVLEGREDDGIVFGASRTTIYRAAGALA